MELCVYHPFSYDQGREKTYHRIQRGEIVKWWTCVRDMVNSCTFYAYEEYNITEWTTILWRYLSANCLFYLRSKLFPDQTESCFSSFVNSLVFQFFFSSLKFNFIITLYPAVTECRHKVIISGLNRKKVKNLVICISYHSVTCTIWPIFYEFLIFFAMRWGNGGYKNYVIPQMIWRNVNKRKM